MDPSGYDIWVDDHNIDDVGEQTPFRATVIERTRDGLITPRADDDAAGLEVVTGRLGEPGPSRT